MFDDTLASAFVDDPTGRGHKCLGVKLLPFCLWHRFLLKIFDSPFLRRGTVDMEDLRLAVAVCRLKPFNHKIRKPRPGSYYLRRGFQSEVDRFLNYCGDYIEKPEWVIIPPPRPKGAPPAHQRGEIPPDISMVGDIVHWSGWDEKFVWSLPIGRAYWYQMLAQRAAGLDVDFVDQSQKEWEEDKKRVLARFAKLAETAFLDALKFLVERPPKVNGQ